MIEGGNAVCLGTFLVFVFYPLLRTLIQCNVHITSKNAANSLIIPLTRVNCVVVYDT